MIGPLYLEALGALARAAGGRSPAGSWGPLAEAGDPGAGAWEGPPAPGAREAPEGARPDTAALLPLEAYDAILVGFSGGKDSVGCVLQLLELAPHLRGRIELWHHSVDGRPGTSSLFDWPCTEAYCQAIARALGLPLRFSWREGGFLGELERAGTPTAPVTFETPSGERTVGGAGPPGTRGRFPQVSADLSVRWCSPYLKIMVAATAITHDPRFRQDARVLLVTGERRQESANRARYARVEVHRSSAPTLGRVVHQWRPLLDWREDEVWGLLQRWGIVPHPCYWLGFGRASCEVCIFSGAGEWATLEDLHPERVRRMEALEKRSGQTIDRSRSIRARIALGQSFAPEGIGRRYWTEQALRSFDAPVQVPADQWALPPGAFVGGTGPV